MRVEAVPRSRVADRCSRGCVARGESGLPAHRCRPPAGRSDRAAAHRLRWPSRCSPSWRDARPGGRRWSSTGAVAHAFRGAVTFRCTRRKYLSRGPCANDAGPVTWFRYRPRAFRFQNSPFSGSHAKGGRQGLHRPPPVISPPTPPPDWVVSTPPYAAQHHRRQAPCRVHARIESTTDGGCHTAGRTAAALRLGRASLKAASGATRSWVRIPPPHQLAGKESLAPIPLARLPPPFRAPSCASIMGDSGRGWSSRRPANCTHRGSWPPVSPPPGSPSRRFFRWNATRGYPGRPRRRSLGKLSAFRHSQARGSVIHGRGQLGLAQTQTVQLPSGTARFAVSRARAKGGVRGASRQLSP